MILFISVVAVAVVMSFMCSLSEACLLSLSPVDIARISEKRPARQENSEQRSDLLT